MTVVDRDGWQFLTAEDDALKLHLSGITVADARAANRPVNVHFRFPERDWANLVFPFITIEDDAPVFDAERAHSYGEIREVFYSPDNREYDTYAVGDTRTPWMIPYTVATHCRSKFHDRQINRILMMRLHPREAGLDVAQDNTLRRIDFYGAQRADYLDDEGKRVFQVMYSIGIPAETTVYADTVTPPLVADGGVYVEIETTVPTQPS